MKTLPLSKSVPVELDSSGNGQASIGPTAPGEIWLAGYVVSVHVATNANEALCRVYCGSGSSAAYFCDGTTWGSTGDSTNNTPEIHVGEQVFAVWQGGDANGVATLNVRGTKQI